MNDPTVSPVIHGNSENGSNSEQTATSQSDRNRFNTYYIIAILCTILFIIVLVSWIYSKCININDFYKLGALIQASIHIVDTYSDIIFVISISYLADYPSKILSLLLVFSVIFIIFPVLIGLLQLNKEIKIWKRNDDLKEWISDNITFLYILSIITGSSFTAIQLCSSNIFNLHLFGMPLNKMEMQHYQTQRLFSTVLLEVCISKYTVKLLHTLCFFPCLIT